MTVSNWYIDVDFVFSDALSENLEFDVLDVLAEHSAVFTISRDRFTGGISLILPAPSAQDAVARLSEVMEPVHALLGDLHVSKIDVMDEQTQQATIDEHTFPELVGYVEIAQMASVSRQRARQLAERDDFPIPVVETASGPLRVKTAVEDWLVNWHRIPGRPKRSPTP